MEEDYKVRKIPENFENGIHIAGFSFKPIFLIEGIILAVIAMGIAILVMKSIGMNDIGQMIGFALVFGGVALFLGLKGINDEPLTTYIKHLSEFNKGRRVAYYNPRIKVEAKSIFMEKNKEDKDAIPREKIIAFFNKYKAAIDKKQQEKAKILKEDMDSGSMFFEDDIGIIKKPKKYMSEKETKELDKKKRKIKEFKEEING